MRGSVYDRLALVFVPDPTECQLDVRGTMSSGKQLLQPVLDVLFLGITYRSPFLRNRILPQLLGNFVQTRTTKPPGSSVGRAQDCKGSLVS